MQPLTDEEVRLAAVGTLKAQQGYLVRELSNRYYLSEKVWSVLGKVLRRYSFEATLFAAKTVVGLDDENFFAKMGYACRAYEDTFSAETCVEDQKKSATQMTCVQDARKKQREKQDPQGLLVKWLFEDRITAREYERVKSGEVSAEILVQEVEERSGF